MMGYSAPRSLCVSVAERYGVDFTPTQSGGAQDYILVADTEAEVSFRPLDIESFPLSCPRNYFDMRSWLLASTSTHVLE